MATTVPAKTVTVRSVILAVIKDALEDTGEVDQEAVSDFVINYVADDTEMVAALLRETLPALVSDVLQKYVHQQKSEVLRIPTGAISRVKVEATVRERLAKIFESTRDGYKPILSLTKAELLDLNERDQRTVDSTMRWIGFRSEIAAAINEGQTAGELPSRVLQSAWNRHLTATA